MTSRAWKTWLRSLLSDNAIGKSTVYDYLDEGFTVLAAQAPALGPALPAATMAGHSHSSIDGTLIETDRRLSGWSFPIPRPDRDRSGWGAREGKTMIATLRHRLIRVPARLIFQAGQPILRRPSGRDLLAEVLARLRKLPALP